MSALDGKRTLGEPLVPVGASGGVHLHWERRRGRGFGLAEIETQPAYVYAVELVGSGTHKSGAALAIDTGDVLIAR